MFKSERLFKETRLRESDIQHAGKVGHLVDVEQKEKREEERWGLEEDV